MGMRARLLVIGALLVVFHSAEARADDAGLAEIFGGLGFSADQTNELIASTESRRRIGGGSRAFDCRPAATSAHSTTPATDNAIAASR